MKLSDFATTPTQKLVAEKADQGKARQEIADELDTSLRSIQRTLQRIKRNASRKGWDEDADLTHPVGANQVLKGASTLYDEEGKVRLQWVKSQPEIEDKIEVFAQVVEELTTGLKPLPVVKPPKHNDLDLLTLYTFTDYHLGALAQAKETGADWDVKIAEKTLWTALTQMMESSPSSQTAIFNLQGDWQHFDSLEAVTPTSGHLLDADTRLEKLVELSIKLAMSSVNQLLKKHLKVKVIICEGNHDITSSVFLRKTLKTVFGNNDRVEVDDTSFPYYAHKHGDIMLGFHHGHKKKNKDLPALFASEPRYREMWGASKYTYIHTGHYHHAEQDMAEAGGAIVERHPTLAARDAYAARGGWVSWRAARAITYHNKRGEVQRVTVVPEEEV